MKVLFFDIDGTLTNFNREIPASAVEGIRKAREKGNLAALCSGRSESQIEAYILDIGFDAIVSAAGARVSVGGKPVYEHTLDREKYLFCLDQLLEVVTNLCVQTNECVYVWEQGYERLVQVFSVMFGDPRVPEEVIGTMKRIPDLRKIEKPQKIFYHQSPIDVEETQKRIGDYFLDMEMSFGKSDPYSGEITTRGIEKSTGMEQLMRHFGLSAKDSVAFGDGPNDLDMMQYAGLSICMGGGREETKKRADYVTADVDDDGIYRALEHFRLI